MGSSSSSSQANQETNNSDLRVATGNYSTAISAQNSTVYALDQGALRLSYAFAGDALDKAMSSINGAIEEVGAAWGSAKAGEQKVLVAGGLIVVGIVALTALKGLKA